MDKALYGLKQAPRAWYGRIDSFLSSMGFTKSKADPNLYLKVVEDELVILLLYVDDLSLTGNEKQIMESKKKLAEEFEMKELGLLHYFLGLEVWKSSEEIFLNQVFVPKNVSRPQRNKPTQSQIFNKIKLGFRFFFKIFFLVVKFGD